MIILLAAHLVTGMFLGFFFRVWILVPAVAATVAECILMLINWADSLWSGFIWSFGLLAALELGYLFGSAVRPIVARSWFRWKRQREDTGGRS